MAGRSLTMPWSITEGTGSPCLASDRMTNTSRRQVFSWSDRNTRSANWRPSKASTRQSSVSQPPAMGVTCSGGATPSALRIDSGSTTSTRTGRSCHASGTTQDHFERGGQRLDRKPDYHRELRAVCVVHRGRRAVRLGFQPGTRSLVFPLLDELLLLSARGRDDAAYLVSSRPRVDCTPLLLSGAVAMRMCRRFGSAGAGASGI